MLQSEADIGTGQFGQPQVERSLVFGGATQGDAEPLVAMQREGIEQRLLVGKVTARGSVAYSQFPAQFTQGEIWNTPTFERTLSRAEQGFAKTAMMIRAGRRFHLGTELTQQDRKAQYVSIDNIVSSAYIPASELANASAAKASTHDYVRFRV